MMRQSGVLAALLVLSGSAFGIGMNEVAAIIEAEYPGAVITEIDRETYRGQKVLEVDFQYGGEALEAIVGLDGKIIKVEIDD